MANAFSSAHGRDIVAASGAAAIEPHGLYFQDAAGRAQLVSPEAIAQTLSAAGSSTKLVVLNACFTESIADALLSHVDYVIGMSGSIHDDAARSFAIGFYGGLAEHASIAAAVSLEEAGLLATALARACRFVSSRSPRRFCRRHATCHEPRSRCLRARDATPVSEWHA